MHGRIEAWQRQNGKEQKRGLATMPLRFSGSPFQSF
jgi:hypothetical protein